MVPTNCKTDSIIKDKQLEAHNQATTTKLWFDMEVVEPEAVVMSTVGVSAAPDMTADAEGDVVSA